MTTVADHIRKLAGTLKEEGHLEEVKVFFSAPNPRRPGSETMTIEEEPAKEANFQWVAYQALFSRITEGEKEPTYYIYDVELDPTGKEKMPNKVFESDSNWSGKNKDIPAKGLTPGDAKRTFPEVLKGPNLFPSMHTQTVYINTDGSDKGHVYSSEEFKKFFDNEFYVVLNPRGKELINPFGTTIGIRYPKTSGLRTWSRIRNEYEIKYGKNHQCLRLECVKCGNTRTCRCSTPKTLEKGVCDECMSNS